MKMKRCILSCLIYVVLCLAIYYGLGRVDTIAEHVLLAGILLGTFVGRICENVERH